MVQSDEVANSFELKWSAAVDVKCFFFSSEMLIEVMRRFYKRVKRTVEHLKQFVTILFFFILNLLCLAELKIGCFTHNYNAKEKERIEWQHLCASF